MSTIEETPMQETKQALAYDLFVEAHTLYAGKSAKEIRAEISPDEFEARIRAMHYQYMAGQFSFGRFTELAGVANLELREILDALGLPPYN
jgi:predicted HTH domain antitoxin